MMCSLKIELDFGVSLATVARDEDGIRLKSGTVPTAVSEESPSLCHWEMSYRRQSSGKAKSGSDTQVRRHASGSIRHGTLVFGGRNACVFLCLFVIQRKWAVKKYGNPYISSQLFLYHHKSLFILQGDAASFQQGICCIPLL